MELALEVGLDTFGSNAFLIGDLVLEALSLRIIEAVKMFTYVRMTTLIYPVLSLHTSGLCGSYVSHFKPFLSDSIEYLIIDIEYARKIRLACIIPYRLQIPLTDLDIDREARGNFIDLHITTITCTSVVRTQLANSHSLDLLNARLTY